MLAGSVSLGLHGGLVVLALALVGARVARPSRPAELTWIEVAAAPSLSPPTPVEPTPAPPTPTSAIAGLHSRRGHEVAPRTPPRAPTRAGSRADLKVSYDDLTSFAAPGADDTPAGAVVNDGQAGLRVGDAPVETNVASFQIPAPPTASLARRPRPKHAEYRELRLHAVRQFAGQAIHVSLQIDATGRVTGVQLVHGVDPVLDQRTIEIVRTFEFEPALDRAGEPVPGTSPWQILIVDDDNPALRGAVDRGHY
jgi:TonB family protein